MSPGRNRATNACAPRLFESPGPKASPKTSKTTSAAKSNCSSSSRRVTGSGREPGYLARWRQLVEYLLGCAKIQVLGALLESSEDRGQDGPRRRALTLCHQQPCQARCGAQFERQRFHAPCLVNGFTEAVGGR